MKAKPTNCKGFTLLELMVALAISTVVTITLYSFHASQQRSHTTQEQTVDMQQSLRTAMYFLERELKMAGYDPTLVNAAQITAASANSITFSMDVTGGDTDGIDNDSNGTTDDADEAQFSDGDTNDPGEIIVYGFQGGDDADTDGIVDAAIGAAPFCRNTGGGLQAVGPNFQAIAFAYAFDNDDNGQLDASGLGNVYWAFDSDGDGFLDTHLDDTDDGNIDANDTPGGTLLPGGLLVNLDRIRAIRIWMLARTNNSVRNFHDNRTYVVGDKHITPADDFKRRLLTATVRCRNMG